MTRYELLDRIGVGGMAEIFRGKAVAAGGFEKPVAIKRILPHLSQDTRFVELLIAEAKVLSLLKHRNIVQIFDVGLGDDGQYFLVMEYVDGKDLGAVQRGLEASRKRMPFDLALHVGAEICEALEHAHTARAPDGKAMLLVHRDVSPSNVLLSRAGECKLTDFGIAKRAEQEQTGHGAVRGKFAYISPEQARNEHIDPRSDVFSVGILLWELLTNRRLFSGLGDLEALRAVRDAQVPRPTEADPRLDPQVDKLLMAALARDLKARPTAGQLGAQLRTLRYSLESTVGDPATELAKFIDTADEVERQSQRIEIPVAVRQSARFGAQFADVEHTEATVIRIRTADEFSMRDKDGTGMARIRQVIDHFEEEQTRQATLSGDQLRFLRQQARHDSAEIQPLAPPLPGVAPASSRSRRPTDEPTRAHAPLYTDDGPTVAQVGNLSAMLDEEPNAHLPAEEHTRLVARSRDAISRRTPEPQRAVRPITQPPPPPVNRPGPPSRPQHPSQAPPPMMAPPPMQLPMHAPPPMPMPMPMPQPMPPPPGYQPWQQQQQQQPPPPPSNQGLPMFGPPPHLPQVAGFDRSRQGGLKPWMLVVGAIVMAALAFAITRAFLS